MQQDDLAVKGYGEAAGDAALGRAADAVQLGGGRHAVVPADNGRPVDVGQRQPERRRLGARALDADGLADEAPYERLGLIPPKPAAQQLLAEQGDDRVEQCTTGGARAAGADGQNPATPVCGPDRHHPPAGRRSDRGSARDGAGHRERPLPARAVRSVRQRLAGKAHEAERTPELRGRGLHEPARVVVLDGQPYDRGKAIDRACRPRRLGLRLTGTAGRPCRMRVAADRRVRHRFQMKLFQTLDVNQNAGVSSATTPRSSALASAR